MPSAPPQGKGTDDEAAQRSAQLAQQNEALSRKLAQVERQLAADVARAAQGGEQLAEQNAALRKKLAELERKVAAEAAVAEQNAA
eukprot:COSAG03_NODE_10485_length_648_cov_0.930783_1_plen_84_part_01